MDSTWLGNGLWENSFTGPVGVPKMVHRGLGGPENPNLGISGFIWFGVRRGAGPIKNRNAIGWNRMPSRPWPHDGVLSRRWHVPKKPCLVGEAAPKHTMGDMKPNFRSSRQCFARSVRPQVDDEGRRRGECLVDSTRFP